jgi:excisionase family DNA binding protein
MSHASRDRQTRPSRRFVSLPQAAEYVGVTRRTLERVINRGELTAYRLGKRCTRVDLNELEDLMLGGGAA